jgi:hypothetical protein
MRHFVIDAPPVSGASFTNRRIDDEPEHRSR